MTLIENNDDVNDNDSSAGSDHYNEIINGSDNDGDKRIEYRW